MQEVVLLQWVLRCAHKGGQHLVAGGRGLANCDTARNRVLHRKALEPERPDSSRCPARVKQEARRAVRADCKKMFAAGRSGQPSEGSSLRRRIFPRPERGKGCVKAFRHWPALAAAAR